MKAKEQRGVRQQTDTSMGKTKRALVLNCGRSSPRVTKKAPEFLSKVEACARGSRLAREGRSFASLDTRSANGEMGSKAIANMFLQGAESPKVARHGHDTPSNPRPTRQRPS